MAVEKRKEDKQSKDDDPKKAEESKKGVDPKKKTGVKKIGGVTKKKSAAPKRAIASSLAAVSSVDIGANLDRIKAAKEFVAKLIERGKNPDTVFSNDNYLDEDWAAEWYSDCKMLQKYLKNNSPYYKDLEDRPKDKKGAFATSRDSLVPMLATLKSVQKELDLPD